MKQIAKLLTFALGLFTFFSLLALPIFAHQITRGPFDTLERAESTDCPADHIKEIQKIQPVGRGEETTVTGYHVFCNDPSGTTPLGTISQPEALRRFGTGEGGIGIFVLNILTLMVAIAGVLSFVFILIGGISLITASGDKTKIESARSRIVWAVVGLAVVIISFAIMKFVENFFGVTIISGGFDIPEL